MDEPQHLPEPVGPSTVDLVAAALAADGDLSDVAMFTRVLTRSFADVLPAGVLEVEQTRSLGDRLAGRPGTPVALRLTFPERRLELRAAAGWPEASVQHVVRGVVLSRAEVPVHQQRWGMIYAGLGNGRSAADKRPHEPLLSSARISTAASRIPGRRRRRV